MGKNKFYSLVKALIDKSVAIQENVEHIHTDDFKTEKVQETPTIIEQQVESPIQAKVMLSCY